MSKIATVAYALILGTLADSLAVDFHLAPGSLKYPGCADIKKSDFSSVTLMSTANAPGLTEPTRFCFSKSGRIFFLERNGGIRVIEKDGSIVKLGTITVLPLATKITDNNEFGLVGLSLDPDFESNGWIYVVYEPPTPDVTRISRFTVTGQTLNTASEQNLITLPNQRNYCCHTGGGMQFDSKGDLWVSIGNNMHNGSDSLGYVNESSPDKDDQGHSANTNDFRGKILRIHPLSAPGPDGKWYSIPSGNLKEYYSSLWSDADKAKVLPELYTMGHRSNYTISVDTTNGWLAWGDIGPDEGRQTEELNVTTKPGFMGWPYFAGSKRDGTDPYAYKIWMHKDENAPMNMSKNNTGVQRLPPAVPATFGYREAAAITGPIYHWNKAQTGAKKLPPHFDGKWLIGDFNVGELQVATLDANANMTARTDLIDGFIRLIDIKVGPDGCLYTLEYATSFFATDKATQLKRWEYNGPACAGPASSSVLGKAGAAAAAHGQGMLVNFGLQRTVSLPEGARGVDLYDMRGKLVWASAEQAGETAARSAEIPASVPNGLYRAVLR